MVYLGVRSLCCIYYGSDKCIKSYTYHYCTIQNSVTAPKITCVLPSHPSSLPCTLATTDVFSMFVVWPLSELHMVRLIQYVVFSDLLLSCDNMHCHSLTAHFFLSEIIVHSATGSLSFLFFN